MKTVSGLNVLQNNVDNDSNNEEDIENIDMNDGMNQQMDLVEELDLGVLDELTQEDKIFLIHQIEDLNKNIRYC